MDNNDNDQDVSNDCEEVDKKNWDKEILLQLSGARKPLQDKLSNHSLIYRIHLQGYCLPRAVKDKQEEKGYKLVILLYHLNWSSLF